MTNSFFWNKKKNISVADKLSAKNLKKILGFNLRNYHIYKLALTHKSASSKYRKNSINNERLEFLGDAILDSIIAECLYHHFPGEDEGFLTRTRSKLVNRENLQEIAVKMGLDKLVISKVPEEGLSSLFGNALEAIVGAIYLDKGYKKTKAFIEKKIIAEHIDLDKISEIEIDFKSRMIEWAQKNKKEIDFVCMEQERSKSNRPAFVSHLLVFDEIIGMGMGKSKKEAEQNAAKQAIKIIDEPI